MPGKDEASDGDQIEGAGWGILPTPYYKRGEKMRKSVDWLWVGIGIGIIFAWTYALIFLK